ncbi:unnamed protein product [Penicillium salamii]|nr:unnamed protein product [Penicillium salamii]CAG8429466.1 unnamed protein product [Penicillium salamii]
MSAFLESLRRKLYDFEPLFVSPDDLQRLDIQASQVSLTSANELKFNPCFFRPHPDRLFEKYPPVDETDIGPPRFVPDVQKLIDHDPSDPVRASFENLKSGLIWEAFLTYEELFSAEFRKFESYFNPSGDTLSIEDDIYRQLRLIRKGSGGDDLILHELMNPIQELWL